MENFSYEDIRNDSALADFSEDETWELYKSLKWLEELHRKELTARNTELTTTFARKPKLDTAIYEDYESPESMCVDEVVLYRAFQSGRRKLGKTAGWWREAVARG